MSISNQKPKSWITTAKILILNTSHLPPKSYYKEITDTVKSALFLDIHLEIDGKGKLLTKLFDKRDDFSFHIVNFLFICGNISSASAYGVFISQLVRYARDGRYYAEFLYLARIH